MPRNETSIVASFCPRLFPRRISTHIAFSDENHSYLFALGTQTTLLIYSSEQLIPLSAFHTDSPISDIVWGEEEHAVWVCAACLDGRVLLLSIPISQL